MWGVYYKKNYKFIRCIDDYSCYEESCERAQKFLIDLSEELRHFDLALNHKKTSILELPIAQSEQWVRKINSISLVTQHGKVNYKVVQSYLDLAVELMKKNNMNASVLNYAIKVLSKKPLTDNAKEYFIKTVLHFAVIYPYLIPLLEPHLFSPLAVDKSEIDDFSQIIFKEGVNNRNFEAVCYAIFFALRYDFALHTINAEKAVQSESCLFELFAFLYFKQRQDKQSQKLLREHAKELSKNDDELERNWLFIYEVLPQSELKNEWKAMKKSGISFLSAV